MAPVREGVRCSRCGTRFLPFRGGDACPGCSLPAKEHLPIVEAALQAYGENCKIHGDAVPPVIEVRDLWDDYLYRALFFLKALDRRRPRETEEQILRESLEVLDHGMGPGWRAHLEAYYRAVLRAWHEISEREK